MQFKPIIDGPHPVDPTGTQRIYRFDNGYGASVVRFYGSYGRQSGLFELAVIHFGKNDEFDLDYDTPITDDVIGWLTDQDVTALLVQIQALPPKY